MLAEQCGRARADAIARGEDRVGAVGIIEQPIDVRRGDARHVGERDQHGIGVTRTARLDTELDRAGQAVDRRLILDHLVPARSEIEPGAGDEDRKSRRPNSTHYCAYRMPDSAIKKTKLAT